MMAEAEYNRKRAQAKQQPSNVNDTSQGAMLSLPSTQIDPLSPSSSQDQKRAKINAETGGEDAEKRNGSGTVVSSLAGSFKGRRRAQ